MIYTLRGVMRAVFAIFLLFWGLQVEAQEVRVTDIFLEPVASEGTVLTIKGPKRNIQYTLSQVEKIGLKKLVTSTYWPDDNGEFNGVLLRDLLRDAGIERSSRIKVTALDDYTTIIPREDWQKWDVLVATRHEKKVMSIRQKGPLRMIYPKDIGGEVAASDMRIRWIWAIKTIEPAL